MIKNLIKNKNNISFSSKLMLHYGLHLGGNQQLLQIETSSVVFGIRASNLIINLSFTSAELLKTLNIIKVLGLKRSIIYFINSILGFRFSLNSTFGRFNRHLFFPIKAEIKNVFKKLKFLLISIKKSKYEKKNSNSY